MNLAEKMERFPLKVYFPYGGKFQILQWKTYSEGNHVLMAKNEEQLVKAVRSIIHKLQSSILPVFCFEATVVSPPEFIRKSFAEASYEHDKFMFLHHVTNRAYESMEALNVDELPGARKCTEYRSGEEEGRSLDDEFHIECVNCTNRVVLDVGDEDEFYRRYRNQWEEVEMRTGPHVSQRARPVPVPQPRTSMADPPDPSRPVMAVARGSLGIEITEPLSPSSQVGPYGTREFRLFFQGEQLPIPDAVLGEIDKWDSAAEERKRERADARNRVWDAEKSLRTDSFLRFMEEVASGLKSK